MIPFILDTDSASLFLAGNQKLIARLTQSVGGTIITRNHKDFTQVPNLEIEDWTL